MNMGKRLKTIAILALLFLLLAMFWGIIGNYLLPKIDNPVSNTEGVNFISVTPILHVNNMEESLKYYKYTYGFETIEYNSKYYDLIYIKKGSAIIGFSQIDSTQHMVQLTNNIDLIFEIDQINKFYNSVKDKCDELSPVIMNPSGNKSFSVVDNNGFKLTFTEKIAN